MIKPRTPWGQWPLQGDQVCNLDSQLDQGWNWDSQTDCWDEDWNQGNWDKLSSKDNYSEGKDRPYLSHLDFPSFNGNKDDFANYRYTVLHLKSQCGQRDHTNLAPRLISNFKGATSEDVRAMKLNSSDYQVPDGVEKLLTVIRRRLNIRELDLETEIFQTLL